MRKLIFATQKLDPDDPVLAATVPMVRALAARVDELVVLCDSARARRPCRPMRACASSARRHRRSEGRGSRRRSPRAAPAADRRRRAHGPALRRARGAARAAARDSARPLVHALEGPRRRPRCREGVHGDASRSTRARFRSPRGRCIAIGHGIDVEEFTCTDAPGGEQLRALVARPLLAGQGARDDPARRRAGGRPRRGARLRRELRARTSAGSRSLRGRGASSAVRSRAPRSRRSSRAATC